MSIEEVRQWKEQGLTVLQISENTGKSKDAIYSQFKYHNVKPVPSFVSPWNLSRIYDQNDADGLYVIGLLAADGYLAMNKTVCIWISENDVELLYRIKSVLMNENANINRRQLSSHKTPQVNINIGSVDLVRYLGQTYGFSDNKSKSLPFPHHLQNPLPFLRGFFDGDGHMGLSCTFTCGSDNFVQGLLQWVFNRYGYTPNVQMVGANRDCYNVNFRKKHELFIRDLFSYPGLARKTEAFLRYLPN